MLHVPFNNSARQVNRIWGRLSPNILDKLTVLTITADVRPEVNIDLRSNFNIVISNHDTHPSLEILKVLLTNYNLLKRNPHVYLTVINDSVNSRDDLTPLISKQLKELRFKWGIFQQYFIRIRWFSVLPTSHMFYC